MKQTPNRRRFLKSVATATATATLLTSPVAAKKHKTRGGKTALKRTPVYFAVYAGRGNDPAAFGFPDTPAPFRGFDYQSQLFDSSEIEATPNGQTLHYGFKFLPNYALVGTPKPYILTHNGDGRYEAKGQNVNFELGQRAPQPFNFLGKGKWRAVGKDIVKLTEAAGDVMYAVTRVDFYDRQGGDYVLSLLYVMWAPGVGAPVNDPRNPHFDLPEVVATERQKLLENGRIANGDSN